MADEKTIYDMVEEQLAGIAPDVAMEVANRLAQKEVKARADKLLQGMEKKTELDVKIKKMVPDNVLMDKETGNVVSETYTKAKWEERKKAIEQRKKLESAIHKAYTTSDFGELNKLLSGGQGPKPEGGAAGSGTDDSNSDKAGN